MPVGFLTEEQRQHYGRFVGEPTSEQLACYFHLDDNDRRVIGSHRGDIIVWASPFKCAPRFLGTFLEDLAETPPGVIACLARQLGIQQLSCFTMGSCGGNTATLRVPDFSDSQALFRLNRWLYTLCWTGTDRPGVLFRPRHDLADCTQGAAVWCDRAGAACQSITHSRRRASLVSAHAKHFTRVEGQVGGSSLGSRGPTSLIARSTAQSPLPAQCSRIGARARTGRGSAFARHRSRGLGPHSSGTITSACMVCPNRHANGDSTARRVVPTGRAGCFLSVISKPVCWMMLSISWTS